MSFEIIQTNAAPQAIGTYSQATKINNLVFISGQIALDPQSMKLVSEDFSKQAIQVFENLRNVTEAAGGSLKHIVKLTVYLTDLNDFQQLNEMMAEYFTEPYPARAAVEVSALPKGAKVEVDAIMVRS